MSLHVTERLEKASPFSNWVVQMSNQMLLPINFTTARHPKKTITGLHQLHIDVRFNADSLQTPPQWREVVRHSEFQCRTSRQLKEALDASLSECALTNKQRTTMIFQSARHYLARTCRRRIHENDNRQIYFASTARQLNLFFKARSG